MYVVEIMCLERKLTQNRTDVIGTHLDARDVNDDAPKEPADGNSHCGHGADIGQEMVVVHFPCPELLQTQRERGGEREERGESEKGEGERGGEEREEEIEREREKERERDTHTYTHVHTHTHSRAHTQTTIMQR